MLFLARWARKLSWKETAESFHTSWDQVCDAVEYVVGWGLERRTLESIRAIGVDEIQYAKGHKYLTLVYQIDQGLTRLLWVGKERTCTTNLSISLRSQRISSRGVWNEHVHSGIGGGNHGRENRPSFFRDLVTVALLDLLNEAVV